MSLLNVDRDQIEKFLEGNRRKMVFPEYYFGIDNNQNPQSNFTDDRLKILILMLSTGSVRSSSNTYNAMSYLATKDLGMEKVFVDYCYYPAKPNMDIFSDNGIPWIFGNVSHEPISSYDAVFVSNALIPEVVNITSFWENSGIPFTIEQREKEDIPMLFYGGAASRSLYYFR